ncbi:MAG: GNAT family N-acetyltransferase, partial [Halobacteriaceae archaeon]
MQFSERLQFDHDDRRQIYEHVERNGPTTMEELEHALEIDPGGLRHHVAILRRDGYLREEGGRLRLAFERGATEEYQGAKTDFTIRPPRQEDLGGLIGAIRQVASEGTYIEAETVADVLDHENVLMRHNEIESRIFFVATVNGDVVGWVHLHMPE